MTRYRFREHHFVRSTRALVAFDVIGEDADAVMAWQLQHPIITVEPQEELVESFDGMLNQRVPTGYKLTLESYRAQGMWIPRPTWMDEDLPAQPELVVRKELTP
jgi:hypothetical protein